MTMSGATTLRQSRPGGNCDKMVLHILPVSKVGASLSDGLISFLRLVKRSITPLQGYRRCILQPQPSRLPSMGMNRYIHS